MNTLKFAYGNAKLKGVYTFSLPAGWSCPGALACLARADKETGRITDGDKAEVRCFSASEECRPSVRKARWHNFNLLKGLTQEAMIELLLASIPPKATIIRIHVSGDFWSQAYFDSWLTVAQRLPDVRFYFYTKSLPYWLERLALVGNGFTPGQLTNVVPTASFGGKYDSLIEVNGLRWAKWVLYDDEAIAEGLALDHDDSHAMVHGPSFALSLHGTQQAGTAAARAIADKRRAGNYGYNRKTGYNNRGRVELTLA